MEAATLRIAGDGERGISKRVAFNKTAVGEATCPPGKDRVWIYDSRQPGLALMVTAAGGKSFYTYRKVHGRPQRNRLGGASDISVEQARKLAAKTLGEIASGADPMAVKRAARARGMTIGELWTWFLSEWAKPRKRSWIADESRYDEWLSPWASRRLTDIKRSDVAALHQQIGSKKTQATANRVLSLLSTMFNKAKLIGWEKANPCQGVSKFQEQSRDRFLSGDELKRFLASVEAEAAEAWKDFFKLALFTGARRGNLLSMRWDELDLATSRWTIPAEKFKNKRPSVVYLSAHAVGILIGRKEIAPGDWVFPSDISESKHLATPTKAWKRVCKSAGLSGVRIHDLRRTFGSWQAASGASLQVIGKSLGHRSLQTTTVYSRLELDPIKLSVDKATAAMVATSTEKEAAK